MRVYLLDPTLKDQTKFIREGRCMQKGVLRGSSLAAYQPGLSVISGLFTTDQLLAIAKPVNVPVTQTLRNLYLSLPARTSNHLVFLSGAVRPYQDARIISPFCARSDAHRSRFWLQCALFDGTAQEVRLQHRHCYQAKSHQLHSVPQIKRL